MKVGRWTYDRDRAYLSRLCSETEIPDISLPMYRSPNIYSSNSAKRVFQSNCGDGIRSRRVEEFGGARHPKPLQIPSLPLPRGSPLQLLIKDPLNRRLCNAQITRAEAFIKPPHLLFHDPPYTTPTRPQNPLLSSPPRRPSARSVKLQPHLHNPYRIGNPPGDDPRHSRTHQWTQAFSSPLFNWEAKTCFPFPYVQESMERAGMTPMRIGSRFILKWEDWRQVFMTSKGLVTIAPHIPPSLCEMSDLSGSEWVRKGRQRRTRQQQDVSIQPS